MTPFQALFGYSPPNRELVFQGQTNMDAIKEVLQQRVQMNQLIKSQLERARNRKKQLYDKRRNEREFQVGDMVFLKLQPYRQTSVTLRRSIKMNPRYYGPYKILQKVGVMAYKLLLLAKARIHYVISCILIEEIND